MVSRRVWTTGLLTGALTVFAFYLLSSTNIYSAGHREVEEEVESHRKVEEEVESHRWKVEEEVESHRNAEFVNSTVVGQTTEPDDDDQPASKPFPHEDLYTRNLTLINMTNFKFLINNDVCNVTPIAIVTIVHSAVENKKARDIIRTSWGSPNMSKSVFKLVFLLGATSEQSVQENIAKENEEHHDIVQGDFLDTYRNLSYKNIMGKLWVSQFCEQAEFVVKTDDDQYVDLYEVLVLAGRYSKSVHYVRNRLLLCPVWRGLPILRDPESKWFASYEDIPRDPAVQTEVYPTDCTGWFYITSPGTAAAMVEAATRVKFFWIDDVWVTGYIARHLDITHLDIIKFWTMNKAQLLLYKSIQNPTIYHQDFLSGPMDRDASLSLALHRRATWCYKYNCYNNIYREHSPVQISQQVNNNVIKKVFPF